MTGDKASISLIIVDDHQLSREGIKALLSDIDFDAEIQVAGSGREALERFRIHPFDIALVDINMPEMSGIELAREIKKDYPATRVLALSMYDDHMFISQMIEAGASGYILKNINLEDLLEAIKTVANGGFYVSGDISKVISEHLLSESDPVKPAKPEVLHLSFREQEILDLIAREFTNQEIARQLFISERTVETHRKNLFLKTKQKTIIGLIKYAIEHKLLK
jgi:DNA-binding NarL/FixJ family response regulator